MVYASLLVSQVYLPICLPTTVYHLYGSLYASLLPYVHPGMPPYHAITPGYTSLLRLSGASLNGVNPGLGGSREPLLTVLFRVRRLSGASFTVILELGGSREPLYTRFTVG